ncbi:DUF221-domain-containing protein [Decorospora gaudefroyi]|uniref:DUF221-domain-containing protein n=1 Tax=Decorospora gaudefroyi TaxID=184978 RepID=A0A6A5K6P6_9PLEO|nr:DUF221-domain-containing protein [Decorospora gaudefroyi]
MKPSGNSNNTCGSGSDDIWGTSRPRDVRLQVYMSLTLGLGAFLTFCFLRPRWKGLYAARKKQNDLATALPELPDSFFGWIIPLWKITDEQVLASAGLDAYVYLAFFKMAIKFLLVTLFFALAVIKPVHDTHQDREGKKPPIPRDPSHDRIEVRSAFATLAAEYEHYTDYLWMYLVFVYLFTALILYLIVSETRRIIDIRQKYLGSQTTITDRTIRLSGIPVDLRSEDKIKEFMMDLGIGKVESVTLCKNWRELDDKVIERQAILRKLEEAWTVHLGSRRVERSLETLPVVQPCPPEPTADSGNHEGEASYLLGDADRDPDYVIPYAQQRPTAKIWYGRFKLRYKRVDAIDYYEEKLRRADDEIRVLRKKDFEPTPLAFVTMDSVASAQMAIQAVLDPSPLQLLANNSPAPSDVVWENTYLSRAQRIFRSWAITLIIGILSVFWTVLLVPIAGALNTCSIKEVFPRLAEALDSHEVLRSLVNTQLPTLALTLMNVTVPFLYDWLANKQGMISQGDVELSVISKNFFFTFFNFFILFTILGTASGFLAMLERFAEKLTSATQIAYALATSLSNLLGFYTNFIILQGFGLFPFRLMEFGALSLYPVYLIGAKTPRDYAELVQPPIFSYGFFLPQTILIFIICMVYSVLKDSWQVLLTGLAYFMIGHFVHKYQLLYAMEHRQHSTGRGWTMMCDRVIVGVVLFQITVAGQLALKKAFKRAVLTAPLVVGTIWFLFVFARTYRPLMQFLALRSLRDPEQSDLGRGVQEESVAIGQEGRRAAGRLTLDEARERAVANSFRQVWTTSGFLTNMPELRMIYLSRGVAGTKSEPALPGVNPEPFLVASYLKSPTTRRLSLSPLRYRTEQMSPTLEHGITTPLLAETNMPRTTAHEAQPSALNRSEVLRHVFPRPLRSRTLHSRKATPRVTKPHHSNTVLGTRLRSRPRVAFQRYLTSFFGGTQDRDLVTASPETRSRASSFRSGLNPSIYGSIPSLDVVSPAMFAFSGPSLRSAGSYSDSPSHLPSLTGTGSDAHLLRRAHTDSFSMLDDASMVEDAILQPGCDQGILRTVTDVLLSTSMPTEEGDRPLLVELEHSEPLTNRAWYRALSIAAPPKFPTSYQLPVEIVQHVYDYLGPKDFNAARHTCRGWMRASLDKHMLVAMLSRGGWLSSAKGSSCATHAAASHTPTIVPQNEEWLLSRHLSRQCALSSGWTGNGLDARSALVESSEIDFSELANGYSSGLIFSTSLCSRFLCVARETMIYIYGLEREQPMPLTSVVCPRRALEVSMDVSSGRHAIAALLEGRMGIVCELQYGCIPGDECGVDTSHNNEFKKGAGAGERNLPKRPRSYPYIQENITSSFNAIGIRSNDQDLNLQDTDDHQTYDRHFINRTWNLNIRGLSQESATQVSCFADSCTHSIPIESGTSTFYRHLCSEEDPPRSVSICPQRRCVAFGCSAGIELHWIDAITGQSLSRWFPLTAPSDYLFFLSPRPGFESAKKLRLISSAAQPEDRPAIRRKLFGRPTVSSMWASLGFESASQSPVSLSCDHYRAIPLSDGYHVLFIDPASGRLTLGCDAPLGGPTKLLRKIMFIPPEHTTMPRLYSATADLSEGVRVVVAYGESIMLYSVPPDWDEPSAFTSTNRCKGDNSSSIWPLAVRGSEIGTLAGVCELAIHARPDILIRAFTHASQCKTWRLRNYVDPVVCSRSYVCKSGIVHNSFSIDETRDVIMEDAPPTTHISEAITTQTEVRQSKSCVIAGFDGNASGLLKRMPKALAAENDEWVDLLDVRGCSEVWYDEDGDVIMRHGN